MLLNNRIKLSLWLLVTLWAPGVLAATFTVDNDRLIGDVGLVPVSFEPKCVSELNRGTMGNGIVSLTAWVPGEPGIRYWFGNGWWAGNEKDARYWANNAIKNFVISPKGAPSVPINEGEVRIVVLGKAPDEEATPGKLLDACYVLRGTVSETTSPAPWCNVTPNYGYNITWQGNYKSTVIPDWMNLEINCSQTATVTLKIIGSNSDGAQMTPISFANGKVKGLLTFDNMKSIQTIKNIKQTSLGLYLYKDDIDTSISGVFQSSVVIQVIAE